MVSMSTFLLLQRVEDYAAGAMLWSGKEGASVQRKAIRALGGKVLAQYALMGPYDVMLLVDLPDDETALAIALSSQEGGFYTEVMRAFSPVELRSVSQRLAHEEPPAAETPRRRAAKKQTRAKG